MKKRIQLVITDVDNTLFDWVRGWAAAAEPMLTSLAAHLSIDRETAERHVRKVHLAWGATECPSCLAALDDVDLSTGIRTALSKAYERDFVSCRPVFAGVPEALARFRDAGVRVVAYTESPASCTARRLASLGLDTAIDRLYARADTASWLTEACSARPVRRDRLKPNPDVLHEILADEQVPADRAVYVGDNLWKDVAMAQRAGVHAAWAAYGSVRHPADEALLARLCHWTAEQGSAERSAARDVRPEHILHHSLLDLFDRFTCGDA